MVILKAGIMFAFIICSDKVSSIQYDFRGKITNHFFITILGRLFRASVKAEARMGNIIRCPYIILFLPMKLIW